MIRRRYISTRLLQPGMVIDQNLVDRTRRILIARKTVLSEFHIQELTKLGVTGVYIREGEEDPDVGDVVLSPETEATIQKLQIPDKSKVQLSESVKKRVSEGIQFLYSNTDDTSFSDTANQISGELMKAITENDAVALNIDALKVSDEYTFKHSVDVATLAMIIAKKNQMSEKDVYNIGVAGLLHDMGKSKIPNEILNKPGRLTDDEFEIMKQHSVFGYRILKEKEDIPPEVTMGVLQHHEKLNGKGYPMGVVGEQICPYARILSVADVYDALVTERPYKKAFSQRDAVEILMSMTEELDINALRCFLDSVILYPVGSVVDLSNGEKAKVVANNPGYPLRPKLVGLKSGKVYNLSEDVKCASLIIE